jgi:hypothetical protein
MTERHFRLGRDRGRHVLIDPQGQPFFSLGLNHLDSAAMRSAEADGVWESRFGNSQQRWLEDAGERLRQWGFNTVGWVQDVVVWGEGMVRHSRNFLPEEYAWLGMPHGHMLPFTELHQWDFETRLPDLFSKTWEDWCDYVARDHCARMRDDPLLIGYFYSDCPVWAHHWPGNAWRGSLAAPSAVNRLNSTDLAATAERYYAVTRAAIRRYDPHHLILGDRFEANAALPAEVWQTARRHTDVLCFQDFDHPVDSLARWHAESGMPVLWADGAPVVPGQPWDGIDGHAYRRIVSGLRANAGCIGSHLCGAYVRNRCRAAHRHA